MTSLSSSNNTKPTTTTVVLNDVDYYSVIGKSSIPQSHIAAWEATLYVDYVILSGCIVNTRRNAHMRPFCSLQIESL